MLKKFQSGYKYTTDELKEILSREFETVTLRTVQRDLVLLQDCEPTLESSRIGKKVYWHIPRNVRPNPVNSIRITADELLSLHILKSHLKTFSGTVVEEEIQRLLEKLEEVAPNEIYSVESMMWDQNFGSFDYTQYDHIIRRLVKYISERKWTSVEYSAGGKDSAKRYLVMPRSIFTFSGSLYCVAYVPYYKNHIALAVQFIDSIEESPNVRDAVPEFDFKAWTEDRFGVYEGVPKKVVLRIKKEFNKYFENRRWHTSQEIGYEENGDMRLEMRAPLSVELVAWIMSWDEVVTVVKPGDLIKTITKKMRAALANYKKIKPEREIISTPDPAEDGKSQKRRIMVKKPRKVVFERPQDRKLDEDDYFFDETP
ncbi:MAG: helix-turn-helix transcriptional regulator [Chloroflexota bacterium]